MSTDKQTDKSADTKTAVHDTSAIIGMATAPAAPSAPTALAVNFADLADKSPTPAAFNWNGQEYPIHPLPNETWLLIFHTLDETSGIFQEVASGLLQKMAGETGALGENVQGLTGRDVLALLPALPKVLKSLLPCQSAVVAAGLRLDVETVASKMPLAKKVEALRLIAEAENLPAVWRELSGMLTMFRDGDASASSDAEREKIAAASRN